MRRRLLAVLCAAWVLAAGSVNARATVGAPPQPTDGALVALDPELAALLRWARRRGMTNPCPADGLVRMARKAGLDVVDLTSDGSPDERQLVEVLEYLRDARDRAGLPSPPRRTYRIVNPLGGSRAEAAYRALVDEGVLRGVSLVILNGSAGGVERRVYDSLRRRRFRATTGPDEGIDTRSLPYCPACIFVPREEVDAISLGSWRTVLLHEARHVAQARNNPDMAADFASADGGFTVYAAFCEACADDGLYTTPMYRAKERLPALRETVGIESESLIRRACQGHKDAYMDLRALYNRLRREEGAFDQLFRPFVW